jgi:hypothetical protein
MRRNRGTGSTRQWHQQTSIFAADSDTQMVEVRNEPV